MWHILSNQIDYAIAFGITMHACMPETNPQCKQRVDCWCTPQHKYFAYVYV